MPTVIAELCQNHNGDKGILRDMVWAAAEAGADYAKIQTIFADELTPRDRFEEGAAAPDGSVQVLRRPYQPEYERLKGLEIGYDLYEWYLAECTAAGIRPLTTVFTRAQVDAVADFGWDEAKVASYDCASLPLLDDLSRRFRHLFVSTGATFDQEIAAAAELLRARGTQLTLLHCVTIYPTPREQLHLARMRFLRTFADRVGFSDHSAAAEGIAASAVALHLGADVIERHFSVLPGDRTKDGPVSASPDQLAELCRLAHGTPEERAAWVARNVGDHEDMLGVQRRDLSPTELANRDYYRGRFASRTADGWLYNWASGAVS